MQKVGFAVFFTVAVLGAVLLLISQIPLTREYYDVVDNRSFSLGEPLTFYWTFEANAKYRFEVKGVDWVSPSRYGQLISVGNFTDLQDRGGRTDPPWEFILYQEVTCTYNVTFFHRVPSYNYTYIFNEIERATTTSATVEISQLKKNTYHLTYLMYVGLPLLIIGAIVITMAGKDVDSRMRMPDTSAGYKKE